MKSFFAGKTVLVTGGTGSIGSAIVRRLLEQPSKLVKIYARSEHGHWLLERELELRYPRGRFQHVIGDVRDATCLGRAIRGVDIVLHTAGLKHIPYGEQNPEETTSINVQGAMAVIAAAMHHQVDRVVALSTDKAVHPNSIMGISKLLMERLFVADRGAAGARTRFAVVRLGNVMNSRGSVIPRWVEQIRAGQPISITDRQMRRYFVSVDEAVRQIFNACRIMQGRETIVPKMAEVGVHDLAQQTIREHAAGRTVAITCTGMREREKLREQLLTEEERATAIERDAYYIILPSHQLLAERQHAYA